MCKRTQKEVELKFGLRDLVRASFNNTRFKLQASLLSSLLIQQNTTSMASKSLARSLLSSIGRRKGPRICQHARAFSISSQRQTDGVFRELTNQRVQKPWIEAFRDQQSQSHTASQPPTPPLSPKDRDLTPKRMKDSYYSVVRS
jgi:acyl-coenzyme A thioesterase 9